MSLYSKGCCAQVVSVKATNEKYIVAEICTARKKVIKGKQQYVPDWQGQVLLMNANGETVNVGDSIVIKSFMITNRTKGGFPAKFTSYYIEEWAIAFRNKYKSKMYKQSTEYKNKKAQEQREQIEAEIQAQDAALDELINSINADDNNAPF